MIEILFIYGVLIYYHIWWALGVCVFLNGIAWFAARNDE